MSSLKTFALPVSFLITIAGSVHADNSLVKAFASCTGRYSAEMEHAWLVNDPKASDHELRRRGFVALLEATVTPTDVRRTLSYRVNTKHAHSLLLQVATFSSDASKAKTARDTASRLLEQCDLLLLGGA